MELEEFSNRFEALREKGFVKSLRSGPTGIGYTLETLLGIAENNSALPDIEGAELKATRSSSGSMITLFTCDRNAWVMPPLVAIQRYGTIDRNPARNGRRGLYFTMSRTPNGSGLRLSTDNDHVSVVHTDGTIVARWPHTQLAEKFERKFPSLLLVSADTQMQHDGEYFHYTRAMLLSGSSPDLFRQQLEADNVLVDLRLHDKGTRARNHGTGFRAFERSLPHLFQQQREL